MLEKIPGRLGRVTPCAPTREFRAAGKDCPPYHRLNKNLVRRDYRLDVTNPN